MRNKARPEGSIAEAYVDAECLTFCSMHLEDIETRFNRQERNFDRCPGQQRTGLAVFNQNVRPIGARIYEWCHPQDLERAHYTVLNNCDETLPYFK